ncbi:MAG: hypothetical protein M0006_13680 [Magnetospirillum sp.]|nr:hypothetical protein [Magnetospirillum sp.]
MSRIIHHIDEIGRRKQRDVVFVAFDPGLTKGCETWTRLPIRQQIIDWLDAEDIAWTPCAHFASENHMCVYRGQIYIDVPHDPEDPGYRKVAAYFEFPDGTMRLPGVTLYHLPLSMAMTNAHHDEPGFWERWAENF